jgi:hypothetical protein
MTTYANGGYQAASPALADRAGPATPSMVADQLDALLGEHLMPLRVRQGSEDEPHLLAVDASGEPVVVEIVALLDEEAAITALRHAGRAARMSTVDLARAYSGGAERFAVHLSAFRLTVPSTALLSTLVRGGSRLLLVCSHIAPGVEDVLEFLLQPGWQVDVLRAEVVAQPDGSRVVELSPVSRSAAPDRTFEPAPWGHGHSDEPSDPYGRDPQAAWSAPTAAPVPIDLNPRWSGRADTAYSAGPLMAGSRPGWSSWPPDDASELLEQTNPTWAAARPAPIVVPPSFAIPVTSLETEGPDPALAAVASVLDGPVVLVWCPPGAPECYEALLHTDGMIELADGSFFGDVDSVSRAISDFQGPLDTWEAWRIDSPGGPTLAELAEELFPGEF